jgi:hypothetical protein
MMAGMFIMHTFMLLRTFNFRQQDDEHGSLLLSVLQACPAAVQCDLRGDGDARVP